MRLARSFQIDRTTNVKPRLVHWINDRTKLSCLKPFKQRRHVAMLFGFKRVKRGWFDDIDAGVHMAAIDGLFLKAGDFHAFGSHHAKRMLPLVRADRHGRCRALSLMEIKNFAVAHVGEHVPVGYHESIAGPRCTCCQSASTRTM